MYMDHRSILVFRAHSLLFVSLAHAHSLHYREKVTFRTLPLVQWLPDMVSKFLNYELTGCGHVGCGLMRLCHKPKMGLNLLAGTNPRPLPLNIINIQYPKHISVITAARWCWESRDRNLSPSWVRHVVTPAFAYDPKIEPASALEF